MRKEEDEDQRVRNLFREITKLLPERSKIKTDLLYFKYAPILVMLFRWYSVSQFYDSKMEITLWYEENEEPAIPTGTTGTLPILFETNGSTQAVTKYNGAPLTVADVQGTGVYQFWFERDTNTLQIMSGIV